ncbi:MAG: DUF2924 domain-containing protein [Armatimonadota bacterium]
MRNSILKQVVNLSNLSHDELKNLYITLHGSEPPAYNRDFIIKRLAYRLQEIAFGGLSERVQKKLDDELDWHGYDANAMPKSRKRQKDLQSKDHPVIGCVFMREWHGKQHEVTTLREGFEYEGVKYRSLTAIAKVITGQHMSGKIFFGLKTRKGN